VTNNFAFTNILVKDNNYNCFRLLNEEGQDVSIDVLMADDQIERDKRREIVLVPKEKLKYGKKYIVIISKDLMSKSGALLEKNIEIFFTKVPEKA